MVTLPHDVSTVVSRSKNLPLEGAQLLDMLFLHFGQYLFGFRLRDDRDVEFPHTNPQLEVGFLSSQLVFRMAHIVVAVEGENDSMPSCTHVVNTGETLSNLVHTHVQTAHFAVDSTKVVVLGRSHVLHKQMCTHVQSRGLSQQGEQVFCQQEPPISLHRCRNQ